MTVNPNIPPSPAVVTLHVLTLEDPPGWRDYCADANGVTVLHEWLDGVAEPLRAAALDLAERVDDARCSYCGEPVGYVLGGHDDKRVEWRITFVVMVGDDGDPFAQCEDCGPARVVS
jgi:hypothetical protein